MKKGRDLMPVRVALETLVGRALNFSDCEIQGIVCGGCDKRCPALRDGKCPLTPKEQEEILRKRNRDEVY